MRKLASKGARDQVRKWIEQVIKKAQDPDPREKVLRERRKKRESEMKKYGL